MFADPKVMKHLNVIHDSVELCSTFNNENTAARRCPSAQFRYNLSPSSYFKTQFIFFFHSPYVHSFEPVEADIFLHT